MMQVYEEILKTIRAAQQEGDSKRILAGGIKSFEEYKYFLGRLHGLKKAEELIKDVISRDQ
jgi:hypothetical protein